MASASALQPIRIIIMLTKIIQNMFHLTSTFQTFLLKGNKPLLFTCMARCYSGVFRQDYSFWLEVLAQSGY
jgi:hypothetical protein